MHCEMSAWRDAPLSRHLFQSVSLVGLISVWSMLQLIYDRKVRVNTGNSVEEIHVKHLTASASLLYANGIITCANKETLQNITVL